MAKTKQTPIIKKPHSLDQNPTIAQFMLRLGLTGTSRVHRDADERRKFA